MPKKQRKRTALFGNFNQSGKLSVKFGMAKLPDTDKRRVGLTFIPCSRMTIRPKSQIPPNPPSSQFSVHEFELSESDVGFGKCGGTGDLDGLTPLGVNLDRRIDSSPRINRGFRRMKINANPPCPSRPPASVFNLSILKFGPWEFG